MKTLSIISIVLVMVSGAGAENISYISQNFEDTGVFTTGVAWQKAGVGDGTTDVGLWRNPLKDGDYTPKVVLTNSSFSSGTRSVYIIRNGTYGKGSGNGVRTSGGSSDAFVAEFSFMPENILSQTYIGLLPSDQTSSGGIAVRYSSDQLATYYDGAWHNKTSMVTPGQWHRIKFEGSISSGLYYTYLDTGSGYVSIDSEGRAFNTTIMSDIAGLYFGMYDTAYGTYIDDVSIEEIILVAGNISQDFEDTTVFPTGVAWQKAGVGDGNSDIGLWRNPYKDGDYTPKVVSTNSSFSSGARCVYLFRNDATGWGPGSARGVRTSGGASDVFVAEFSFMPEAVDPGFVAGLLNKNQELGGGIAVRYSSDTLSTWYEGAWHGKTSLVTPGQWHRIKFEGSISEGLYYIYLDTGSGYSLKDSTGRAFDTSILSDVSGLYWDNYNDGANSNGVYLDDFSIVAIPMGMLIVIK